MIDVGSLSSAFRMRHEVGGSLLMAYLVNDASAESACCLWKERGWRLGSRLMSLNL